MRRPRPQKDRGSVTLKAIFSTASAVALPLFIVAVIVFGLIRRVDIYESFIAGAKGGISISFRILPYIVAMIFAVDIFRAGGCFDFLTGLLSPLLGAVGIPPEVLPIALMRPFSGGASTGLLAALLARTGADSYAGRVASTFMGSSETLFYTLSVYFGSVGISKTRYVIPVALVTDAFGVIVSCLICRWVFG